MPLYFTIQRGSTVVKHTDRLQTNEVLDISEWVSTWQEFENGYNYVYAINFVSSCHGIQRSALINPFILQNNLIGFRSSFHNIIVLFLSKQDEEEIKGVLNNSEVREKK